MINRDFTYILKKLKSKLLKADDDYEGDKQDYGLSQEDTTGLSEADENDDEDDEEDEDAAAQFLKEKEKTPQKTSSYREWEPHGDYTDDQQDQMDEHMDDGYSHREAELFANAGKDPSDFISALNSRVKPSQPSDKHLSFLKEAAAHLVQKKKQHDLDSAHPEKQPLKFAAGQANKAHSDVAKDFKTAYNDYLESDDVKDLRGAARTKAVRQWKKDWHSDNPDHDDNLAAVDHGKAFREAGAVGGGPAGAAIGKGRAGIMGQNINDRVDAIAGVGNATDMTAEEAAQHVGGVNTDEGTRANLIKDPFAGGNIHPEQRKLAQQDREARANKEQEEMVPQVVRSKGKNIIRRSRKDRMTSAEQTMKQHGNADQIERFSRYKAAKASVSGSEGSGEE